MNPVTHFVVQTLERTVAAAAATGVTILGGAFVNALTIDYRTLLGDMGGTAIVTLLICLASQPVGDLSSASIVQPIPPVTKHSQPEAPAAPAPVPVTTEQQPEPARPAPAPLAVENLPAPKLVLPDPSQQSL